MDDTREYTNVIYAISEDEHGFYKVWEGSRSYYSTTCDFYDGRLYIDYTLEYDSNGRYTGCAETCFRYDEDKDSFVEEETGIDDVIQAANNAGLMIRGASRNASEPDCFKRTLDECGFIFGSLDGSYYIMNAKGKLDKISDRLDNAYLQFYGPDCVIYSEYSYERSTSSLYILDIKSKMSYQLTEEWPSAGFLGRDEWRYYYYYQSQEEYGIKHDHVMEYNYMNGETTPLYEGVTKPGSGLDLPGASDFRVLGGHIYTTDFADGEIRWYGDDISDRDADLKDLNCLVKTVGLYDYGTVGYVSHEACCSECGAPLDQKYVEYFILDSEYSSYADVINEALEQKARFFIGIDDDEDSSYVDTYGSSCEEHSEHPSWYLVTDDVNVVNVKIIDDRYLAVDMSGYWYAGGAHGMPSRNQYLFDLETGEELTFADFYTGSLEDFKTFIAEATVEDYESYDFPPYYEYEDLDELYATAYEYAFPDNGCIEFTEDGIVYYYIPYEMGPYASGYIELNISYSEVLGRETLAEK